MLTSANLSILFFSIFASITFNGFFRNIAKTNNILIDIPEKSRKFHDRATPLTGGISIYVGILVSALLLSGLTDINIDTQYSNKGLFKNSEILGETLTRKYQVDDVEYDLSIEKDTQSQSVSVSIDIETDNQVPTQIKVEPTSDGNFLVTLASGETQIYNYDNGEVSKVELDESNVEKVLLTSLVSSNNIIIDTVTLSALICGALIIAIMLFDDLFGLRASYRLAFQAVIAYIFVVFSGESLLSVGNLLGDGSILLGSASTIFTVFCIVGLMNAFNMSDGLNGMCAMLGLVPLSFLLLLGSYHPGSLLLIGSIIGFLLYNLGYLGKKRRVFLGDTGSNLIGFCIAVACIFYSQGYAPAGVVINPVTALWFVAIPVLDCISVMTSRIIKGVMPFRPGRDHLHHMLLDKGLSSSQTLVCYIFASTLLCLFGLFLQKYFIAQEYISFLIFVIFSLCYYVITRTQLNKNA